MKKLYSIIVLVAALIIICAFVGFVYNTVQEHKKQQLLLEEKGRADSTFEAHKKFEDSMKNALRK
jgi:hypothetical protein